jgi:hypothetical protein
VGWREVRANDYRRSSGKHSREHTLMIPGNRKFLSVGAGVTYVKYGYGVRCWNGGFAVTTVVLAV